MYQMMLAKQQAAAGGSAPAADEGLKIEPPVVDAPDDGVLVVFGSTNWQQMGKKPGVELEGAPNLLGPHRLLAGLAGVKVTFVSSSCMSAHVVAIGSNGEVFSWGRNDAGQLGHGDTKLRCTPTRVAALDGKGVVTAATGKAHTIFVSAAGELCACGANKQGCVGPVGLKNKKQDFEAKPVTIPNVEPIASVACGTNFCLALDKEGDVWAWGWSEFGVLGNGSDGEYNKSASSVKLTYEAQGAPVKVRKLQGKKTVQVACGASHCISVAQDGTTYTWGCGDYGRLGHKDQKHQLVPMELPELRSKYVAAGHSRSVALGYAVLRNGQVCKGQPTVFMWGRVKSAAQDAWMYPKPEADLQGWNVHTYSVGCFHNVLHADSSLIAWGSPCLSGELGFGEGGGKSSSRPKKVDALEGVRVAQVACGVAHTIALVARDATVDGLPVFAPVEVEVDEEEEEPAAKGKGKAAAKRKAPAAAAPAKKGKK